MLQILTTHNFDQIVLPSTKPVLIDFWAEWCAPCLVMGPVVEAVSNELDEIVVGKVNVDDETALAQRFNILSIPTFLVFKSGVVVDQFSGSMSKEQLVERLMKHV